GNWILVVSVKVTVDNLSVQDNQFYVLNRPHVFQRIAINSDQVGDLSRFHGAKVFIFTECPGNVDRRRLNRLYRRQAGLHKHHHFLMEAEGRQSVVRVRSGSEDTAGLYEPDDEIGNLVVALASPLKPIGGENL